MHPTAIPFLIALVLLAPIRVAAVEGPEDSARKPWRLDDALGLPQLTIDVQHRTRYEDLDEQFRVGRAGSDKVLALRTLVHARYQFIDWLALGAEFQDSRVYFDDGNTPVDTGLVNAAELLRAYLELSGSGLFEGNWKARFGRTTMDVGSRRLVARNRFRNTINAFTGADFHWRHKDERDFRAFFTFPVQRLPSDPDRLEDNDVQFDEETTELIFWGLFYQGHLPRIDRGRSELYVYGLHEEGELDNISGSPPTRNRQLATPGFRLYRMPRPGHFDFELETALQFGSSQPSALIRTDLDHIAHFHHVAIGYMFDAPWTPRVFVHWDYGSGDQDPLDGDNNRFDTLFGARRWEFGPTSIYGAFTRININTPGIRLEVTPHEKWTSFVDYRAVWLASDRDEWVPTGIQDVTGSSGSYVGSQIEARARFRPFPGNVLLEIGFAHLFAGGFIQKAPNSNSSGDSNYFYTQVVLSF